MGKGKLCNSEKSVIDYLTEKPQDVRLKNVPGDTNTRHNVKQNIGGKVENTQPPAMRGFFMPATQPGDCNKLSGVARNKIPPSGNTCSASYVALNGSRQLLNCPHVKQNIEVNAMQGTNQGIATPVASVQGYLPTLPVCGQDKTLYSLPFHDIDFQSVDYLLIIRTKLNAIDQKQHSHAVILEQFTVFDEDGDGIETKPYGDLVFPVSTTADNRSTPTVNGWKCYPVDMLLDQVHDALLSKQRLDIADLFANTFPNLLKEIKQGRHFKGEFDTEEFIAEFISPIEAQIKAIREQQAKIGGNE